MNILDRYGIKEVADVTFYSINDDGSPKVPVLYLDTLKVTTIEQTAEETEARGGKGNAALIAWDYGKEINVTIEDALFSAKSMAIMFGNGSVVEYGPAGLIMKTEQFKASTDSVSADATAAKAVGWSEYYIGPDGNKYAKQNPKFYDEKGAVATEFDEKQTYFCSYDLLVTGAVIEISANSFPGTYYVTGDTFARAEATGDDEFFQFIIPKAKVQSENTITLEAEGDPSVFNMNLKVLRPADGVMMKLVKYELDGGTPADATQSKMYHNHALDVANEDESANVYSVTAASGDHHTLTIAPPDGATTNIVWTSSDTSKATVTKITAEGDNQYGATVTGVAAGTVIITGAENNKTPVQYTVTVS